MNLNAIDKDVIVKRINGILKDLAELKLLQDTPLDEFKNGTGHKLAEYHLHRALEGVFNISSHILSRLPGGEATKYREIAGKLGEFGIVEKKFAEEKLIPMAKYRNRLVHFYAEITEQELYDILHNNLDDFNVFLAGIKLLLEHPEKYNLLIE